MNQFERSFFRRNFQCTIKNFTKQTVQNIDNVKFSVHVKPFSEKLDFKFVVRPKIINGVKSFDLGVMIHTNTPNFIRKSSFSAKFFIVQSDGTLMLCSEANVHHLNEFANKNIWRSIIKEDDIFADEKKFLNNSSLRIYIALQITKIVRSMNPKSHSTLKNYENLVNNPQFSDFKIICSDGKIVYAHKCILMAFGNDGSKDVKPSQFFRAMIESQMTESKNGEMKVSDVDSRTMLELMRFIYTGKVKYLHNRANDLLIVADKYDIVGLKGYCVEVLEQQLSLENVVELLKISYVLNIGKLRENCIDFIKFNFESVNKRSDYKELPSNIFLDIIQSIDMEPSKHEFEHKLQKRVTFGHNPVNYESLRELNNRFFPPVPHVEELNLRNLLRPELDHLV